MIPLDAIDKLIELAEKAKPRAPVVQYGEKLDWGRLNIIRVSGAVGEFLTIAKYIEASQPKTILALCRALKESVEALEVANEWMTTRLPFGAEEQVQKSLTKIQQILSEI